MYRVRVPATTANIGPGFDALGMALGLYNSFSFEEIDNGLEILGFDKKYRNEENLVYRSMLRLFQEIGYRPKGIRIKAQIGVPISRGLGSSSTCVVAGLLGANLLAGQPLDQDQILNLASSIEGHPDNVAPALLGGLVLSLLDGDKVVYDKLELSGDFKFIALVPDFTISTDQARKVLPDKFDLKDVVANLSSISFLLEGLRGGKRHLLKYGLRDRIHQPYRSKLIPDFFPILERAEQLGSLGGFLSGAGPTIITIFEGESYLFKKKLEEYLDCLDNKWQILELEIDQEGSTIEGI